MKANWKPYPECKPPKQDELKDYIVTVRLANDPNGQTFTAIEGYWPHGVWDTYEDDEILAWTEMPEPYKPEE